MHEATLAHELLAAIDGAAREHRSARVVRATVEIGQLACVVPEALGFAFEVMRQGTLAHACQLELRQLPLVVRCDACGFEGPTDPTECGCPRCDTVPVQVVSGRQLRLVSIDVEDDDA